LKSFKQEALVSSEKKTTRGDLIICAAWGKL